MRTERVTPHVNDIDSVRAASVNHHSPAAPRRLNVLHTVRSLRINGITNVVLRTVAALDADRVQSHLCSIYDYDHLAFGFRELGVEPEFVGYRGPRSVVSSVLRIARIIRAHHIDVVHANQVIDLVLAGAAARLCGVPVVVTLHWTADNIESASDAGLLARARIRGARMARHAVRIASDRFLATRIVAVSDAVATSHSAQLGRWFPMSKVETVYPGLDFTEDTSLSAADAGRLRAEMGLEGASAVLLNIGRLDPVKGQWHLVPMMKLVREQMPGAVLLIAGDGQLRDELTARIAAEGLGDSIRMLGWRLDISALLSMCDVLVVPSETEAAPLPLLEAARQRKPVVATRVGGIPEILENGVNGYSVPRGDSAAMAHAVLRILGTEGEARRMGENAHRIGVSRFTIEASVRALERIYESMAPRVPATPLTNGTGHTES